VYVIWGSTYLGIAYAIQTIPPFAMAGARFVLVGVILYAISRARGAPRPTAAHWRNGALAGTLLFLGGNGLVTWAEQRVPSGTSALLAATSSLWIVLIAWLAGARQSWLARGGIALGAAGVALLAAAQPDHVGAVVLLISALAWALGTIAVRRADLPESTLQATAIEMLTGGIALGMASLAAGEPARFHATDISRASLIAFIYLIAVGSLAGYALYTYLVEHTTPARLGTYAYVNPIVAVMLGWAVAHDPIGPRAIVATVAITAAVAILSVRSRDA
jgi:drug/metabolite transporter (DMT)-like permease